MNERATFTCTTGSTPQDWQLIGAEFMQFGGHLHPATCAPQDGCTEEFMSLYDCPTFDSLGETLPISEFEPMLRRLMAQPRNSIYKPTLNPPVVAN